MKQRRDITKEVGLFLESLYETRGKTWVAEGEDVPADYVGLPDGLLPAVIRQSFEVACAMDRGEVFQDAVTLIKDEGALLGVSARIMGTDPVSDALRLQIMQMSFAALERHDPIQIWKNPIDPIQMMLESSDAKGVHGLLRGLRSADLFDDLRRVADPFAGVSDVRMAEPGQPPADRPASEQGPVSNTPMH